MTASIPVPVVDLDVERQELQRARAAVQDKLARLATISGGGADALADEYIDAVVRSTVEKLQHELVVFGRIDDDQPRGVTHDRSHRLAHCRSDAIDVSAGAASWRRTVPRPNRTIAS